MQNGLDTQTITVGASVTSATAKKPSNTLDKDSFLKLLVAQLQSQDPTQSQDPNQMVQQMTSYSSLEQQQNTNKLLEGLQGQNLGMFQFQAANMVGRKAKVPGNVVQAAGGAGGRLGVDLAANATSLQVVIKDKDGKVVRTLNQGAQAQGSHVVEWDGKDADGKVLADGAYTAEVVALDDKGKAVQSATYSYLRVDSVAFAGGSITIMAGGRSYALGDISEISL